MPPFQDDERSVGPSRYWSLLRVEIIRARLTGFIRGQGMPSDVSAITGASAVPTAGLLISRESTPPGRSQRDRRRRGGGEPFAWKASRTLGA
jgi:hypothetical protein